MRAGAPPEKPPKMILYWLVRLSHLLYTIMLSKRPKAISKNAQTFINHEKISETADNTSPNISAFLGETRPDGMGRPFVLSIMASISLSLYPVSVSAAAEPAATPPNNKIHVVKLIGMSNNHDADKAAPKAVKTNRYQIF